MCIVLTFNQRVDGSIPSGLTNHSNELDFRARIAADTGNQLATIGATLSRAPACEPSSCFFGIRTGDDSDVSDGRSGARGLTHVTHAIYVIRDDDAHRAGRGRHG